MPTTYLPLLLFFLHSLTRGPHKLDSPSTSSRHHTVREGEELVQSMATTLVSTRDVRYPDEAASTAGAYGARQSQGHARRSWPRLPEPRSRPPEPGKVRRAKSDRSAFVGGGA